MKQSLQYVVIGILLAVILYLVLFNDQGQKSEQIDTEVAQHQDTIQDNTVRIVTLEAALKRTQDSLADMRGKERASQRAFKMRQAAFEKEKAKTEDKVRAMADTIPVLQAYIQASDSLAWLKDTRITELEIEKEQQRRNFERQVLNLREEANLWKDNARHFEQVAGLYREDRDRLKRQGKGLKIAAVGGLLVGFLIGN